MAGSFAGNPICISPEEIFKILKYYGLEHSEDNKKHLSVDGALVLLACGLGRQFITGDGKNDLFSLRTMPNDCPE